MSQINFQPIFDYFDEKFDPLSNRIDDLGQKFDNLQTTVDKLLKRDKNLDEEKIIANYRATRLEEWAKTVGKKVQIPFEI